MTESIRCPRCGGLNPGGAEWCGQCHARFAAPTPPPPPPPPPGLGPPPFSPTAAGPPTVVTPQRRGAFTVTGEGITWRCALCENDNPLALQACAVCGASFAATVKPKVERPQRDPNTAALYSLFLPGAGHWYVGMKGQAAARALVAVEIAVVTLIMAISGPAGLAILLGLLGFGMWAVTAHDAYREALNDGDSVIIKDRVLLYLVLGVLALIMSAVVYTGISARGG